MVTLSSHGIQALNTIQCDEDTQKDYISHIKISGEITIFKTFFSIFTKMLNADIKLRVYLLKCLM